MSYPNRTGHTSTLLKDGRVLVTGGRITNNNYDALANAEIYNPITNQWIAMPLMAHKRIGHTATLLDDGRVLIIGGSYNNYDGTASVEVFDPDTEQWTAKPAIKQSRSGHVAQLLPNGKIIIFQGSSLYNFVFTTELYDPQSGSSIYVSDYPEDTSNKSIMLPNGSLLCAGQTQKTAIFDPLYYSWSNFNSPSTSALTGDPVLMLDNRVLLAGGWTGTSSYVDMTYIYDPISGQWSSSGKLNQRRADYQTTSLKTGKVLITGGRYGGEFVASLITNEIYNPQTGVWTYGEPMLSARSGHKATMLKDGRVLVTGGSSNPPEIYSYAPEITSHPSSQNKLQNKSVIFSVVAGGGGSQIYQWKKNGVDIPNATLADLTISNVQLSDAASYTVSVTNTEGSVVSNTAILTVIPDSDGDGLSDAEETGTYSTDPNDVDSDDDGLSDYAEIQTHSTNPLSQDSDGDGFYDAYELQTGKSPTNSADKPSLVAEVRTAVELSFPAPSGKMYRIEGSTNLNTWSAVEEISGTGAGITRFYSTRDTPARFFRVVESVNP
jgi:hypothetical protein